MDGEGLWAARGRGPRYLLFLTAAVNLIASLALATWMRPATLAGGPDPQRMAFIAAHAGSIRAGWYAWMLATATLVAAIATVGRALEVNDRAGLTRYALALVALGALPDLLNDLICGEILPPLARSWQHAGGDLGAALALQFRSWDRLAVLLTGGVANALYAASGWLLFAASARTPGWPRALQVLAATCWSATVGISLFSFLGWVPGLEVSVGLAMPSFVLWVGGVAWLWMGRR